MQQNAGLHNYTSNNNLITFVGQLYSIILNSGENSDSVCIYGGIMSKYLYFLFCYEVSHTQ